MASSLTAVEQINKYEFTADKVLKMLKLDDANTRNTQYKYRATQDFSSSALTEFKRSNGYKNTQLCGWVIERKPRNGSGSWEKLSQSELTGILSSQRINNYAASRENGLVIIYRPQQAGEVTRVTPNERSSSIPVSTSDSSVTVMPEGGDGAGVIYFDVVGFKSNDEEWMQKLKFAQMCLLKECYEWTGHIF